MSGGGAAPTISVVVPVKDEAGNVGPLAREIAAALTGQPHEILFVDDGSSDGTAQALAALKADLPQLRVLRHGKNLGQSRGIRSGVQAARGEIIVTLDGDGQNDPADIDLMLAPFESAGPELGIVAGQRIRRQDTFSKRWASKIANPIRRWLLNDGTRDSVCGWKAMPREVFLSLPYFDNMHRFLIALTMREGYQVKLIDVRDRPRSHGTSKYTNWGRLMVGIPDLFGVAWLMRRYRGRVDAREL